MKITAQIDSDFKSLEAYFRRLLELREELIERERQFPVVAYDVDAEESQAEHFYVSHLITPDLIIGTYSCFEFWIQKICEVRKLQNNLALSYKDIRGKHDLHTYQKYLTLVAGLDLTPVRSSYMRLDELRKVRNILVHNGGHISEEKEADISKIDGISISGSLIIIADEFVSDLLTHSKRYVVYAANANS